MFSPTPASHRIAEILRRQCNAHVGILTQNGIHSWLGSVQSVCKPECDAFSCQQHYRQWFAQLSAACPLAESTLACPAGFRAIAVPIQNQGECIAAVFASGLPQNPEEFPAAIRRFVLDLLTEIAQELQENTANEPAPDDASNDDFPEITGHSEAAQNLVASVRKACAGTHPVLLTGAPGTGKTRLAQVIHSHSARKSGPFLVQSCGDLSPEELESELFGHKRGAFLGAFSDKQGLLDIAHNGTFCLDDIDLLPLPLQSRIAQLLQSGTFLPRGDIAPHAVDVRILATTRIDLKERVEQGEFREDLYYHLTVQEIALPSLSDRRDDIEELANEFLARNSAETGRPVKSLSDAVPDILKAYDWPGNIRELESEIARLSILATGPCIDESLLSKRILRAHTVIHDAVHALSESPAPNDLLSDFQLQPGQNIQSALEEIERRMITLALRKNQGNRTKTAELLGISRRNLIRKIESLQIEE